METKMEDDNLKISIDDYFLTEKEKVELELVIKEIFDKIHSVTYQNSKISTAVHVRISDRLGNEVIEKKYIELL